MATATKPKLVVNLDEHTVTFNGQETPVFTAGQMTLLAMMARHPHRYYTRSELLTSVWGALGEYETNVVATHLSQIRKLLGRPEGWLTCQAGVGYRLAPRGASVEIVERSRV